MSLAQSLTRPPDRYRQRKLGDKPINLKQCINTIYSNPRKSMPNNGVLRFARFFFLHLCSKLKNPTSPTMPPKAFNHHLSLPTHTSFPRYPPVNSSRYPQAVQGCVVFGIGLRRCQDVSSRSLSCGQAFGLEGFLGTANYT